IPAARQCPNRSSCQSETPRSETRWAVRRIAGGGGAGRPEPWRGPGGGGGGAPACTGRGRGGGSRVGSLPGRHLGRCRSEVTHADGHSGEVRSGGCSSAGDLPDMGVHFHGPGHALVAVVVLVAAEASEGDVARLVEPGAHAADAVLEGEVLVDV